MLSILVLFAAQYTSPDRLDLSQRLIEIDQLWMRQRNVERKKLAVPKISNAVSGFFSNNYRATAKELDEAIVILGGKTTPIRNQRYRVDGLLLDSAERINLTSAFLYPGNETKASTETSAEKEKRLNELASSIKREMNFRYESVTRVPSLYVKLDLARKEGTKDIRAWSNRLRTYTKGNTPEYEEDLKQEWKAFEKAQESNQMLSQELTKPQFLWYGEEGPTKFHIKWPRRFDPLNATVVIALHGAGGSPGMFIKSYGSGICFKEANRRGWIFMSPDSTNRAPKDCLKWLRNHDIEPKRVILIGHSMGGMNTLRYCATAEEKPVAVALFAPAANSMPTLLENIPTYVAVGKQEMMILSGGVQKIQIQGKNWPKFQFEEADPAEHLMIVAEKAKAAFQFIDRQLAQK
jgi:hypothetical protein